MTKNISIEHNEQTKTNALYSVNSNTIEHTIDTLMPLIKEAIQTQNINKIGIVPFHLSVRDSYNNYIRYKLLQDWGIKTSLIESDLNYVGNIPYQKGEIIYMDGPYKLDNGMQLDNGLKLIIDEPGQLMDLPDYHIFWRGKPITLQVYWYKAHFIDFNGTRYDVVLPILPRKDEIFYNEYLEILRKNYINQPNHTNLRKLTDFRNLIAHVLPAWALNIHKA